MADRRYHERLLKQFGQYIGKENDRSENNLAAPKEFLAALATWAGKGRDELLQVICREIGQATALVLKEPLTQLLRQKKLQITIELVTDDERKKEKKTHKSKHKKVQRTADQSG